MPRLLALLALAALWAGCERPGAPGGPAGQEGSGGSSVSDLPLPAYPGSAHLGQRRVYGAGGEHVTWDAFATEDPPEAVVAFYRAAVARAFDAGGDRFEPCDSGGGTWRFLREGEGGIVLDVLLTTEPGPHAELADRLPRAARTVVVLVRRPRGEPAGG